jgi:hypothetical protein
MGMNSMGRNTTLMPADRHQEEINERYRPTTILEYEYIFG